jgi:hypothetical protein
MQSSDLRSRSDERSFANAVRTRSWDWLLTLRHHLNVDVQLVDERGMPLLAPPLGEVVDMTRLLASGAASLRSAISAAIRTSTPQPVVIEGVQVVCLGLVASRDARGALVLARPLTGPATTAAAIRRPLEIVGRWVAAAVAAHLTNAPAELARPEHLNALAQLLRDVAAHGSDRELIRDLADALTVWHDIELYGFVDTGRGTFAREVWLRGADRDVVPAVIDKSALPESPEVTLLSRVECEALGIAGTHEVMTVRLAHAGDAHQWLLVMLAPPASQHLDRLRLYLPLIGAHIAQAAAVASAQVTVAMTRRLLELGDQRDQAVNAALDELRRALGARSAGVATTTITGTPVLRHEVPAGVDSDLTRADSDHLVVTRQINDQRMQLTLVQVHGRHFTPQEHDTANAAAQTLEAWIGRPGLPAFGRQERRASARSFADILQMMADETVERGSAVTVMVISSAKAVLNPGTTQRWVAQVRGLLRPYDLIGMLAEGEVGLLLYETMADQGRQVLARLERVARTSTVFGNAGGLAVGIASRKPGDPVSGDILQEARRNVSR